MSLGAPFSTPSSSPPSSPAHTPVDSSPPSSPYNDATERISSPVPSLETSPSHPFSGSTRQSRRPPQYEKKLVTPPTTPPRPSKYSFIVRPQGGVRPFARAYEDDDYIHGDNTHSAAVYSGPIFEDAEKDLWTETISQAIDNAASHIDLSVRGLTYIPSTITDLENLVILPSAPESNDGRTFSRSATATSLGPRSITQPRTLSTVRTATSLMFGSGGSTSRTGDIQLYLGNNSIRFLPHELFHLGSLTVLSLRSNLLDEVPPQISQLKNLRELNVSNNRLKYLPGELQDMSLLSLAVDPNPFLQCPADIGENEPPVSASKVIAEIPPLLELAMRVLLRPASNYTHVESGDPNVLEEYYDPTDLEIPSCLRNTLMTCIPHFLASPAKLDITPRASGRQRRDITSADSPGLSTCPSTSHTLLTEGERWLKPVFVKHAEERFTWEATVAGIKIAGQGGQGRVPIKWRGCTRGCLDYLDPNTSVEHEQNWDVGSGMDVDAPPQFSSEGFDFDD
ncbi:hypothetical protein BD410DRAFT_897349 [Rickenella mellea]|uniref:L domain-like protein n=1 Tax=Rickenella mellea TaxID=50990 RepID=A0A4Y7QA42_9AGAM|nr:hypothetical protein BD410DRAFT_897349 [Rickenella mellea]